jgi:molecular chaperone IbpA
MVSASTDLQVLDEACRAAVRMRTPSSILLNDEDMQMTTIDFTPLFRSAIGFDRLASALESAYRSEPGGYPPYNVEVTGQDKYRITMAVAGFAPADLNLQVKESLLTVSASRKEDEKEAERRFLYRGIATRSFERQFQLADYVKVVDARMQDGLLHIELVREIPEAMKPREIEIRTDGSRYIEGQTDDKKVEKAA